MLVSGIWETNGMDFYLKTTSVYRFVNDDTDEVIGMIADVKKDHREYFFWDKHLHRRSYVEYTIDFRGMPLDTFPFPCERVRLEIERFGKTQDNDDYIKTVKVGIIDEMRLISEITDDDTFTIHQLKIKCFTNKIRETVNGQKDL